MVVSQCNIFNNIPGPFRRNEKNVAFRLMLSSCVCVCVSVCVYAAFVDARKTVSDRDVGFLNCAE